MDCPPYNNEIYLNQTSIANGAIVTAINPAISSLNPMSMTSMIASSAVCALSSFDSQHGD